MSSRLIYLKCFCQINKLSFLIKNNNEHKFFLSFFKEVYCPHVNPPEFGLISSDKPSTQWGYPLNTTLEFTCVQGYRLENSVLRLHVCSSNGTWLGSDRMICMPLVTPTTTTTTTRSTTSNITASTIASKATVSTKPSSQIQYRYEACKIDTTSIIISYANSINTNLVQSVNDFVFKNATIGNFIEHGSSVGYHCKANALIIYMAKCINGTLLMEQNCNELTKGWSLQ